MFSEGTRQDPELWADCCLEHDLRYWAGGMRSQQDRADLRLRDCVSERAGAEMGRLMYFGVRAGHLSPVKIPSGRWGNAWNRPGWIALTDPEIREIEARLQRYLIPREIELRLLESLRHD